MSAALHPVSMVMMEGWPAERTRVLIIDEEESVAARMVAKRLSPRDSVTVPWHSMEEWDKGEEHYHMHDVVKSVYVQWLGVCS